MSLPWIPPYTSSYNSSLCSLNHNLHFSCVPLNSQYYKTKKKLIPNTTKKKLQCLLLKALCKLERKQGYYDIDCNIQKYLLPHKKTLRGSIAIFL